MRLNNMGNDYLKGKNGMPHNKEMAIYCFKQAFELGLEDAEVKLRELGIVVEKDNGIGEGKVGVEVYEDIDFNLDF